MAGCLRPACLEGRHDGVLLGSVVQQWQEDGSAPDAPFGLEAALGEHVPVLGDEVGIPTADGGREHQAQGVAGEGHVAINWVRKAPELVDGCEERGRPNEERLRQVVLQVHDRRLPNRQVPPRLVCFKEVVGQGLKVVLMQLRIIIDHGDHNPGVVRLKAMFLLELIYKLKEGPTFIGGLPWHVVGQIWWMECLCDENKLVLKVPLKRRSLLVATIFTLLEGKDHPHVCPCRAEVLQRLYRCHKDVVRRLVRGNHHHVKDVAPCKRAGSSLCCLRSPVAMLRSLGAPRLPLQPLAMHVVPIVAVLDPTHEDAHWAEDYHLPAAEAHEDCVQQE
mmetsp:Transcript_30385/g.83708  ORF Transcript_30385/g.83708 Transcript_30385/m.83708 type:complete len:333 (+) Transcript_30385:785-1783(+)